METKARRALRAAAPIGVPAEPTKPVVSVARAEPAELPAEPPKPAEIPAEAAEPVERAAYYTENLASQPSIAIAAKASKSWSSYADPYFEPAAFAALAQSQAALARGLEALSTEMAGLALSGIDTATRTATKMLGVKTLSDAIEVNAGFTCSSWDTLIGGSAKLSELGVRLAAETSQPILTQFSQGWIKASRFGS
jgi:phasin protein